MANTFTWKAAEGYDVHLLRKGPESKALINALNVENGRTDLVSFFLNLEGGVNDHGVELDAAHGIVRALARPTSSMPKVHNFILTAMFAGPQGTEQTEIRIHVHDSVKEIWLTPPSLNIHAAADPDECRFTVLARFDDDVVGDITDWDQISYKSVDPATQADSTDVLVSTGGVLKAVTPGKSADIRATLTLPSPLVNPPGASARVSAKVSWDKFAQGAIVNFVAGRLVPNPNDPGSNARDSVRSVVENATNVLFVAEGFRQDQRGDFNNLVSTIVEELRTKSYLIPFSLLKGSINFWSAFVPSEEEGVSALGETSYDPLRLTGTVVPLPTPPAPGASEWSLTEMIHEVGLPVLEEVETPYLPDHVAHWQKLYGAKVTQARTVRNYKYWFPLAWRQPLNERNSAFGIAIGDRPRASQGDRQSGSLRFDHRRTRDANLLKFAANLAYGGYPLGARWDNGKPDFGLVSFVCLSDRDAGQARLGKGYFTSSVGRNKLLNLQRAAAPRLGMELKTAPIRKYSRALFASVWAHECAHVLGVWDEYGNGMGTALPATYDVSGFPNVLAKASISTTSTAPNGTVTTVFDKTHEITWLWPRLAKAGLLEGLPVRASSGAHFNVPLRAGHGKAMRLRDPVRFREWPVLKRASLDPFLKFHNSTGFILRVKVEGNDSLGLVLEDANGVLVNVDAPVPTNPGQQSWAKVFLALFSAPLKYTLICPRMIEGGELRLVAESILQHMSSSGPLTAEPGFDPGLCRRASGPYSMMSPTNLPPLTRIPRAPADIIGLYEGGSYHDCSVYRPAGRCKMRVSDEKTTPFCFVCRYVIVDRVDPTQHGSLDKYYPETSP